MNRAERLKVRPAVEGLEVRQVPVGWFSLPYLVMIKAVREHQAEVAAEKYLLKHPNAGHHYPPPPPQTFHYPFGGKGH